MSTSVTRQISSRFTLGYTTAHSCRPITYRPRKILHQLQVIDISMSDTLVATLSSPRRVCHPTRVSRTKLNYMFYSSLPFRLASRSRFRALVGVAQSARRVSLRNYSNKFHDPVEHATGIEKRELLAHLAGDCDPFRILAFKRGPGTRERPNLVPSAFCSRLIGCSCHPDDNHVEYMWLHQGVPKRCGCGYWFELCPIAPL